MGIWCVFKKVTWVGSKSGAKVPELGATSKCNILSKKQAFDKLSKARINYYTWTYGVCSKKVTWRGSKNGAKPTKLGATSNSNISS